MLGVGHIHTYQLLLSWNFLTSGEDKCSMNSHSVERPIKNERSAQKKKKKTEQNIIVLRNHKNKGKQVLELREGFPGEVILEQCPFIQQTLLR